MNLFKAINLFKSFILFVVFSALTISCGGPSRTVDRVAADSQTDLSGYWNDTDSRLVAEEMIGDLQRGGWYGNFLEDNSGAKPRLIVGNVSLKNATEHIKTEGFVKDIQRELINGGRVRFVASAEERQEVREERLDQQDHSSEETAKRLANEKAADFMLKGSITMYEDAVDNQMMKFYQVDLFLLDIESNENVWMGTKKIKKAIAQKRASF